MKKIFLALLVLVLSLTVLSSCGNTKAYNTQLKQIELRMSRDQLVNLMGDKYQTTGQQRYGNDIVETLEYVDRYKNHFFFEFENDSLVRWWKEVE
ncbi:hypothetical protein [Dysgonomonas sp. 25]|uniref:hypothetical protein n=1 Tax=Dysgonomonas sp. 25 TaxID=2302933 RepID=UPI0013D5ACB8|nr:hypothetical protein [Dysgonomonas sp. 25]NDV68440.1 hypothetical protein [Dysgonomonas sp. 25]